jgi:hypothetical protein
MLFAATPDIAPRTPAPPAQIARAGLVALPRLSPGTVTHLRAVWQRGQSLGNHAGVFAKIGDSITASDSFLKSVGCGETILGADRSIARPIRFFTRFRFPASMTDAWCGIANSFTRASLSATEGWTTLDALTPQPGLPAACAGGFDSPLACELHLLHPAMAIIMYGTNDLQRINQPTAYRRRLIAIVRVVEAAGVVPILSTIPPRFDSAVLGRRVAPTNAIVRAVAAAERVGLVDYWQALMAPGVVNHGVSSDGVHPNLYGNCAPPVGCASATFTTAGLRYGYNIRNYTTIKALWMVKTVITGRR